MMGIEVKPMYKPSSSKLLILVLVSVSAERQNGLAVEVA
jgi:hypothetical protein